MLIKGSDIKKDKRERLLLKDDELFALEEIEPGSGTRLRRFRLREHAGGINAGLVYSDQLNPGVLEKFDVQ